MQAGEAPFRHTCGIASHGARPTWPPRQSELMVARDPFYRQLEESPDSGDRQHDLAHVRA